MANKDDAFNAMSRRNFLKTSTMAGMGLGLGGAGVFGPALAQAVTTISFAGWAFEPQVVEESVKRFMKENPDIRVNYTPLDLQLYPEKMVALFNAGTQADAFYVRDTHLGAWVEAGWLQPIDGLPKLAELNKDIYPATLQTLSYKGKQYGVPYYGDIYVSMYDKAQIAQAGATRTQSDLYVLRAPYSGVVSEVPVVLGDMATPGRPILTLYDPALLRVTAAIPESVVISAAARQAARVELPDAAGVLQSIKPGLVTVLPAVDAGSHTWQIRLDLPAGTVNAVPGKFARVWLSVQRAATEPEGRVFVPAKSVVRRAELTGVYVVDAAGRPSLRQVRLGRASGDAIEVLSGLTAGERVATDPQAAARLRPTP